MTRHSAHSGREEEDPSRRHFLGYAAGAAIVAGVGAGAYELLKSKAPTSDASDVSNKRPATHPRTVSENALKGDPHWKIRNKGAADAMIGYAGQASVLPGQEITLYASTTARSFTVTAYRMGWYGGDLARQLWKSGTVRGHRQRGPRLIEPTRTIETDWGPSLTIPTDGWPEGSYLLRMDSEAGAQRYVPITVRSAKTAGKTVIKNCVATWQAYNTWGGYDLYNGPGGASDYNNRSLVVSLDRPYDANGAYMFLWHEQKLIALAERSGLPLAYVTSMEIDAEPHLLDGASALFTGGHDEYWSPIERANVTAARDAGTNLGLMGANCCFRRTRLVSSRLGPRRQVMCYKTSYTEDPLYGKDDALVTNDYREPPAPNAEASMTGTLYESNPADADYVVATPDSWVFKDTGAQKGTRLRGLVGIEYDRVNNAFGDVQRPIQILSHSPLTCRGVNSYADSAYYTHRSGAGVFNAGTMRWVASMGPPRIFGENPRVWGFTKQVSYNLLRAFADGPAAHKYPAHDNYDAMNEYAGDPIAAGHNLWPPVVL